MYKNLTIENKSLVKRFSHKKRFSIVINAIGNLDNSSILDYGTGDGYFISLLHETNSSVELFGFEPVPYMFEELNQNIHKSIGISERINLIQFIDQIPAKYFDKVTCLEVFEHIPNSSIKNALSEMKRVIKDSGSIYISVPIEVGISSLFKNIIRALLGQQHPNSSFKNIIRSLFYIDIPRENKPYHNSHIGFNYKNLEKIFVEEGFILKNRIFSPFPILGSLLNSQIIYILSVPQEK